MIFVTVGTHPGQFDRLLKRIDQLAPLIKEEIVIQRGFTRYTPKNCSSFTFVSNINNYFKKARLVISHAATTILEYSLKYKKPLIVVPRQPGYKEHIDNHQVEFAEFFSSRTGVLSVININDLTAKLIKDYRKIAKIDKKNLRKLQSSLDDLINLISKGLRLEKPFAANRKGYILNLVEAKKADKILNIGISNIPEIEIALENKVKECWTIDIDKKKIEKASSFLKRTKLIHGDVTSFNFKKGYFDKIVIIEVLEHLEDDEGMMKRIHSLLNKKGSLIIGVPNNSLFHIINPVKYIEHKRHYSLDSIKTLLAKTGFKIVHLNQVESFTLLANLYIHLFLKFILKKNIPFGIFKKRASNTYQKKNKKGLDILLKAVKI